MAEIYVNFERVKAIPAESSSGIQGTTFLEYCSVYRGVHAKRQLSCRAKSVALKLLQGHHSHISTQLLFKASKRDYV